MTPFSLRTRLTLSYAGILAALLTALGLVYYRTLSVQLDAEATSELGEITSAMHGYLRQNPEGPTLAYDRNDPDETAFVERATRYYQIYDVATGRRLIASAAIEPLGLHYTPEEVHAFRTLPRTQDVQTDQGRIRISNSTIGAAGGASFWLQVGVSLNAMDDALQRFLRLMLWSVPACVLVAALAGRWMAGRALAPLVKLAAATREIDVAGLHRRVPVRGTGDELDHVADAFNETLGRLELAVSDMKQFSTALAHELRTPLAVLRGEAELALTQTRSADEYRRSLASQIEELDRLTRLINQLLTLARAESGEIPLATDRVDLGALCASVVDQLEPVAQARRLTLACSVSGPVSVIGDAGWLERLLLNLLDNAIKFTPPGGRISVRVSRTGARARLDVTDTGIGISAEALPHIFERFYQVDPARSRQAEGVGLGLSLARWIAQRHGATMDVVSQEGSGTTVSVDLPLARVG